MEIHEAIVLGDLTGVRKVLQNGVSVSTLDEVGRTLLHWAIVSEFDEITQAILVNTSPRHLRLGDRHGCTVLHYAAACGQANLVRILMDKRLAVDSRDKFMRTPLHLASECGRLDTVCLLLDRGADPDSVDAQGRTPSELAARFRYLEIVEALGRAKRKHPGGKAVAGDPSLASKENKSPNLAGTPATVESKRDPSAKSKKFDLDALLGEWKQEANKSKQVKEESKLQKLIDSLAAWRKSEECARLKTAGSRNLPSSTSRGLVAADYWSTVRFGPLEGDLFKQQSMQSTTIKPFEERKVHEGSPTDSASEFKPIESWEDIWTSPPIPGPPFSADPGDRFANSRPDAPDANSGVSSLAPKPNSLFADAFYWSAFTSLFSHGEDFHWCTEWESSKKEEEMETRRMEKMGKAWENCILDRMKNSRHFLNNVAVRSK